MNDIPLNVELFYSLTGCKDFSVLEGDTDRCSIGINLSER